MNNQTSWLDEVDSSFLDEVDASFASDGGEPSPAEVSPSDAYARQVARRQARQGGGTPTKLEEPGALDALIGGAKRTGRGLATMANVVTGDDAGVYAQTKAAEGIPNTPDQQAFMLDIKRRMETEGEESVWQAVKNVAGATWANPTGAYHEMLAQLPNSGVVMGGMYAGAKTGAALGSVMAPGAGTVIGGLVGGITGMFLGNTAIEGGFIAQDQARAGEYDREDVLEKAAIKGGFITGVDVATMGANRAMFGAGFRTVEKALAGGAVKGEAGQAVADKVKDVMLRHGVDPADKASTIAAMSTNRQMMKEIREEGAAAFWKALPKKQKAAMAAAGITLESFGEGLGEYGGSALAGLDASLTEAVLEAAMSLPQSAAETAISAGLARFRAEPGTIAPKVPGVHPGTQEPPPEQQPPAAVQPGAVPPGAPPPAAPGAVPPSGQTTPPAPEPQQTLQAQLQAVIEGRKPAMLVTPGEQVPENLPTEFAVADLGRETGFLIYPRSQPELLDLAKSGKLGDVLGYGINGKPPGATDVVTARDKDGNLIQDVVTDGRPEVEQAAEQVAGPGGTVETRPATEAIDQRMQAAEAEAANVPAPKKLQAKALTERLRKGEISLADFSKGIAALYADAAPQPEGEAAGNADGLSVAPEVAQGDTGVTQQFTPTHELPDGTPVMAAGEPGLWVDADGNEIEDNYAEPIEGSNEQASPRDIQQDLQKTQERWDAANDRADKMGTPAAREAQEQFENEEIGIEEFERRLDEAEQAPSTAVTQEEKAALTSDRRQQVAPVAEDRREGDRRQDAERRKRVDEMSDEEKNAALLTHRKTGLPNDRAYEESTKKNFQGFIDVDGLKWINDNLNHRAGDDLLKHVGQALRQEFGDDAYHVSGDEFVVQGAMKPQMEAKLRRVLDALAEVTIEADNDRGETYTIKGLGFSYGIDKELDAADQASQRHKQERTEAGLRAGRGEQPPGISRKDSGQDRSDPGDPAEEETLTADEFDDILNEELAAAGIEEDAAEAPVEPDIDAAAHEAATSPNNDLPEPTTAQKEAENYKVGSIRVHGLDISIENPRDSYRFKVDQERLTELLDYLRSLPRRPGYDASNILAEEIKLALENLGQNSTVPVAFHNLNSARERANLHKLDVADVLDEILEEAWHNKMPHHYGRILRTEGADGDHVDVFVGPDAENPDLKVFVIDQNDPATGKFDEHKVMLGFDGWPKARQGYLASYAKDWKGLGSYKAMSLGEFKEWLGGDTTKAIDAKGDAEAEKSTITPSVKTDQSSEVRTTAPVAESQAPAPSEPGEGEVATAAASGAPSTPSIRYKIDDYVTASESPFNGKTYRVDLVKGSNDAQTLVLADPATKERVFGNLSFNASNFTKAEKPANEPAAETAAETDDPANETTVQRITKRMLSTAVSALAGEHAVSEAARIAKSAKDFRQDGAEAVRAWVGAKGQQALVTDDPVSAQVYAGMLVDEGAALNPVLFTDEFFADLYKKAKAALKKKAPPKDKTDVKSDDKIPLEEAAAEALAQKLAELNLPTDRAAEFTYGWNHVIGGGTQSNMADRAKEQVRKGYQAALDWMKAEKRTIKGEKQGSTGVVLKRVQDMRNRMDDLIGGQDNEVDEIFEATNRMNLLPADLVQEGATPGLMRYLDYVRNKVLPFKEWAGRKMGAGRRSWQASPEQAIRDRYETDPDEVIDFAKQYIEILQQVAEIINASTSGAEAAAKLQDLTFEPTDDGKILWDVGRTEFGDNLEGVLRRDAGYLSHEYLTERGFFKAENDPYEPGEDRKKPLSRPRLDVVTRDGFEDHRKNGNITPQKLKETFGFADVTIGESVTAREEQDHLNYAYDALMDLATTLGIQPQDISFRGWLHFSIGALGHGRFAAHFQRAHPLQDGSGTVPVINLTKTRGDGTVAHEWFHALDFFLRTTKTAGGGRTVAGEQPSDLVAKAMDLLAYKVPTVEELLKDADRFLESGWRYPHIDKEYARKHGRGKRAPKIEHARYHLTYGGGRKRPATDFRKAADLMDKGSKDGYWAKPTELFARAAEAFVLDTMPGVDTYLVNDWVAEGEVSPPQYRGTPYPTGDERSAFNSMYGTLLESLEWTAEGPVIKPDFNLGGDSMKANLEKALSLLESRAAEIEARKDQDAQDKGDGWLGGTPLARAIFRGLVRGDAPKDNNALKRLVTEIDGEAPNALRMKEAQEDYEAALSQRARHIATLGRAMRLEHGERLGDEMTFKALLALYEQQPNLNLQTTSSSNNQAYSTPAPIAFLAGRMAGIVPNARVWEPTAGNAMLVMDAERLNTFVNEIEERRYNALRAMGFTYAYQTDATAGTPPLAANIDVVIMNPPFGPAKEPFEIDGYTLTKIDHVIAAKQLAAMRAGGRAVLILGANKKAGDIQQSDRIFFNWLYENYTVDEHFEVSGDLYSRQGAGWPIRIIVISGRAKSDRVSPVSGTIQRVESYEELFNRYLAYQYGVVVPGAAGRPGQAAGAGGAAGGRVDAADADGIPGPAGDAAPGSDRPGREEAGAGGDRGSADERGERADDGQPGFVGGADRGDGSGAGADRGRDGRADGAGGTAGSGDAGRTDAGRGPGEAAGDSGADLISADEFDAILEEELAAAGVTTPKKRDDRKAENIPGYGWMVPMTSASEQADAVLVDGYGWMVPVSALEKQAPPPPKTPPKTPKDHLKTAATETVAAFGDAFAGLDALFGGKGKLGSGLSFDEETYAKAKPLFKQAVEHALAAGKALKEAIREMIQMAIKQWGAAVKPYLQRFSQEIQAGKIKFERPKKDEAAATELQAPYQGKSQSPGVKILTPVNQSQAIKSALDHIEETYGDIDEFLMKELGYRTREALYEAFMGHQVDGVALAIHQIKTGGALIIGDQTGVGKGRQAAAVIRWAKRNGFTPIFITAKPTLYSDMWGDMAGIGSNDIEPFITNKDEAVIDVNGDRLFTNAGDAKKHAATLNKIAESGDLPDGKGVLFTTYDQLQPMGESRTNPRQAVIQALAPRAVFILDEAHKGAGSSGVGQFIRTVLESSRRALYLSATYAKRPDNMPLYFLTDMSKAAETMDELISAVSAGGVPLMEIVSNQLAAAGQFIRRELSWEGISLPTWYEDRPEVNERNAKISDKVTEALRAIVDADRLFHEIALPGIIKDIQGAGGNAASAGNKADKSVTHVNFTAVTHNAISQLLLAIKAERTAEMAIEAHRANEKPVIALDSTLGSFLQEHTKFTQTNVGDELRGFDYRVVLSRLLRRTRRISIKDKKGKKGIPREIELHELPAIVRYAYEQAMELIEAMDADIPASPIDLIRHRVEQAGLTVKEVTGRDLRVEYGWKDAKGNEKPILRKVPLKERKGRVDTVAEFNNGKLDVIIMNVAGSTGISMHAAPKFDDTRPRRMIVAQAALDINVFMQMLGRINRNGQTELPLYRVFSTALPAEKRPNAVLSNKMKKLNANTSSNEKSSTSVDATDLMNKYGDEVIARYLDENPEVNRFLRVDYSLDPDNFNVDGVAKAATGRLALMPVAVQQEFYDRVESEYVAYIEYLTSVGQNELIARDLPFDAELITSTVLHEGDPTSASPFLADAHLGKYSVKKLGKPPTAHEVNRAIEESLEGKTHDEVVKGMVAPAEAKFASLLKEQAAEIEAKYAKLSSAEKNMVRKDPLTGRHEIIAGPQSKEAEAYNAAVVRFETMTDRKGQLDWLLTKKYKIGNSLRVKVGEDTYQGVITALKMRWKEGSPGNPFVPGGFNVTIMVNGGIRRITLPISRLEAGDTTAANSVDNPDIEFMFRRNEMEEHARETRYIVTGNLLAAYGEMTRKGEIIRFTMADGTVKEGMLMPKSFSPETGLKQEFRLRDAQAAYEFFQEWGYDSDVKKFGLSTRDQSLRVKSRSGGGLELTAAGSVAKGGKWWKNTKLTDLIGAEFAGPRGVKNVDVPPEKVLAVLEFIFDEAPLYALKSMQDKVKDYLKTNRPDPQGSPAAFFSRARGDVQPPRQDPPKAAPTFYSQMQRVLEQKLPGSGPATQMKSTIQAFAKKGEFKAEELEWSGVEEWLGEQGVRKVTKAEVLEFLRANEIQVTEKMLGGSAARGVAMRVIRENDNLGFSAAGHALAVLRTDALSKSPEDAVDAFEWESPEDRQRVLDYLIDEEESEPTKFGDHTMPGGENYRELLLTLPKTSGFVVRYAGGGRSPLFTDRTEAEKAARESGGTVETAMEDGEVAGFRSNHFNQPNVLAHVRFNERTEPTYTLDQVADIGKRIQAAIGAKSMDSIANGAPQAAVNKGAVTQLEANQFSHYKGFRNVPLDGAVSRILFVEEVQSDWHQKGRRNGYLVPGTPKPRNFADWMAENRPDVREDSINRFFRDHESEEYIGWRAEYEARTSGSISGVPDAPFKTTWPMLAMKRMIRYAAENGFDRIAWTTGEQQADRYDLSKQISRIELRDNSSGGVGPPRMDGEFESGILRAYGLDGRVAIEDRHVSSVTEIEDLIGKDAADKLLKSTARAGQDAGIGVRVRQISGLDLKVGGEGMKGFYDKILPNEVGKYVKKWGAKIGRSEFTVDGFVYEEGEWVEEYGYAKVSAHSVDITPAMRDAAMQGQPLFSRKTPATGTNKAEIQSAVSKLAANWLGGTKIEVVQSVADLPKNLRDFIEESDQAYMDMNDGERPAPPEAMFDTKRTKVWLIADALTDGGRAQRALLHESVAHYGLRQLLGRDLLPILRQVYFSQKAAVEEIARRYGLDLSVEENRLVAAEEVLAHLAEENRAPKILEKVYVALLNWLRKMGFDIQLTKADLYALLAESRKRLETGRASRGKVAGQIAMSRRRDAAGGAAAPAALFSRQKSPNDPELQSLLNKIGSGPEKPLVERIREGIDGDWRGRSADLRDRLAQASVDQFHGLKSAEQALGLTDHDRSAYIAARMSTSVDSQLMVALMKGPLRWLGNRATFVPGKKGLLDILQPVEDKMDLWEAYMVARRAERLMAEGRENWLTDTDIQRGLQLGDQYPVFKTVAADWAAFNRTMLDFAQDAGLIDAAARKLWENDDYIPFYRIMDDDKAKGPKGRRGLSHQNSGIRMLRGGKAQLNDILENMIMNTAHLIEASMKNHAVRMAVNNMMDTGLMTPAPFKFEKELIPMSQLKPMLVERGVPPDIIDSLPPDMLEGIQKLWALKAPTDKHVIKAMIDGKPKFYYVHDELLLRSLTSIDQQAWGAFMEIFRAPKRWLTTLITADPAFQAANFVRDTLQAFVLSRENITPILSGLKGARKALKKSDEYWEMLAAGGGFHSGFVNAHDPGSSARIVKAEMRHKDFKTTVLDTPRKLWDRWMEFGSAVENANRMAVYEGTVKAGKSKLAAAYEAKDFMDFSLRGDHPIFNFLAQTVPFFNARLQGIYRLGRGMAENPASFAARGMLIALAGLALWAINKDDDRYKDLEEWDKDTYWHFWHGDKHWRFPKPFEVGFIFGTLPERLFEAMYRDEDDAGKRLMERMLWNVWQVFNLGALPQTVAPVVEQVANRDFFRDAPIVGLRLDRLAPEAQFTPWTHETSIQIGRALGVSPARVDHLLQGYFGTLGDYALTASDWMVRRVWDFPAEPAKGAEELPVVKRFYRGENERATRYSTEFYDLFRDLDKTYNTIREYAKTGDRARADALLAERRGELAPLKMLRKANEKLQKISAQARLIHLNRMMSPEEKRAKLLELQEARNRIYKEAVTRAQGAR